MDLFGGYSGRLQLAAVGESQVEQPAVAAGTAHLCWKSSADLRTDLVAVGADARSDSCHQVIRRRPEVIAERLYQRPADACPGAAPASVAQPCGAAFRV